MFTIGKLAEAAAVGVETIRFYQRKGLISVPSSSDGFRQYSNYDLRNLHFIRSAQTAGFTLEEIKELMALDSTEERQRAHQLAVLRLKALNAKILELEKARDSLRWLAEECSSQAPGPCPILKAFSMNSCEP
ncbi:MAG: MerR family transcriptional regulator [Proteobacteria bacterium]|nr:MAG: MerR family transcriptional regulator [Pseudomonadota bacterium]